MIFVNQFAVQNSLITPTAIPVGITPPQTIKDQKWLLMLSGVCIPNLRGNGADWRRETLSINVDVRGAVRQAVNSFSIPRPPGAEGSDYDLAFQVEQATTFAATSSTLALDRTVNAGFAVDSWEADISGTGTDAFSGTPVQNLFNGIRVNVAVRNDKSTLHRVSFHITLLGKIRFVGITIIL